MIIIIYIQMNKVVQDYVLMQQVGKGQYGFVYKAQNRKNKNIYAVKVMSSQKFKQTPKLTQFTNNQITILSKINHINIIKFIQMLRTANNYYLVYQFCNGGTLGDLIKSKGKLTENQALKIFLQLRSAYETLYNQKILHRDLKPTNILFHDGVVKIADFGFCKQLMRENDMAETMVGSPIYMAPQVLKGSVYDGRADLWSLGVILYQMLYGFCPYEEGTIQKLINLIDTSPLKFPSEVNVSDHLKVLIKRILTVKYRERMTPVQFLKYPIDGIALQKVKSNINTLTFKDVIIFIRKMLQYLTETLSQLADLTEDIKYLKFAFLVYKMLTAIQKDIMRKSSYWEFIKITNNEDKWDFVIQSEMSSMQPYGSMVKEVLARTDTTIKTRTEIETNYVDQRYYLQLISTIEENNQIKSRLINCFLINKHFNSVLEKKSPDFTDYTVTKKTLEEKLQICHKYIRVR